MCFCIFSVIFLYFLQKYRCVPKIGFSADISIDVSIDIYIDILIDILIDISIDIYIDILIDILTDKEEGGGKRGVDFFLRSNNPTPTGGEKQVQSVQNTSLKLPPKTPKLMASTQSCRE